MPCLGGDAGGATPWRSARATSRPCARRCRPEVADAIDHASVHYHGLDFVPFSLSLAVIALSVLMDKKLTWEMAGRSFGERSAKASVAVTAGKAAMIATQTWWIGLLAGVGSRWLAARGEGKRERYQVLENALRVLRPLMVAAKSAAASA
ncbi:MAG: hypothetical protein JSR26_03400 [Proteobacteria bacterium]|nr:hypothetical protein [Pseudomonadota bacterium]